MIRRRHVIYVEGYDPQGADGYHDLFRRSWVRFLRIWPLRAKLGELHIDSDDWAHWDVDAAGPNWQVATRYDFLRQEQMIRANMAEPMPRLIGRALLWTFDYLFSGTIVRVSLASWRYGACLHYFQGMLLAWLALSVLGGWLAGHAAVKFGAPVWIGVPVGLAAALVVFQLLRLLANRYFVVQINSHWPHLVEFARGKASCFDRAVETGAQHLVAAARANQCDELLVIGHSGGGVIAPAVMVRALEIDPNLGHHGPRVVLLTLGSIMPGAAIDRRAVRLHSIVRRLAVEPSVRWIDAQSRKDFMNFWDFDPVEGIGVHVGPERCNPLIWKVRFREVLSPAFYKRIRLHFFRLHYQFIMANDRRAAYDYFILVCGPAPAEQWARRGAEVVVAFAPDAAYDEARVAG